MLTEEFYGFMNVILHGTAVIGHAQKTYPFDPCEQRSDLRCAGDTPGIEPLVEIYPDAHADDLLDPHKSPLRSQDIVVEQYGASATVKKLFDVGMRPDFTFLMGHDAPRTAVHASARQKPIGFLDPIKRVIRAYMFDLFGKNRRIVPVTRPGTHDLAVVAIRTIARKGKDLRHIDLVITPRRGIGELHRIAPALVPCREFHQRYVREVMPVHIHQSDPHDYCFKSSAISGSRLPRYSIRPSKRHASRKCSRPSALRPSREQAMARRYSVTASLGIAANSSNARSL